MDEVEEPEAEAPKGRVRAFFDKYRTRIAQVGESLVGESLVTAGDPAAAIERLRAGGNA